VVILIVFNPMKSLVEFFRYLRHERLITKTPLLDGFEHVALDEYEILRVYRKRRMCAIRGHLWEIEALIPSATDTSPYTYHLSCASCFPHIHSRRTHKTYNLFAISEKDRA